MITPQELNKINQEKLKSESAIYIKDFLNFCDFNVRRSKLTFNIPNDTIAKEVIHHSLPIITDRLNKDGWNIEYNILCDYVKVSLYPTDTKIKLIILTHTEKSVKQQKRNKYGNI